MPMVINTTRSLELALKDWVLQTMLISPGSECQARPWRAGTTGAPLSLAYLKGVLHGTHISSFGCTAPCLSKTVNSPTLLMDPSEAGQVLAQRVLKRS